MTRPCTGFTASPTDGPPALLFLVGTRPEAIKLAPVILAARARADNETRVCATAQHREMLDQVLELFEIKPDYDLALMRPNQTLEELTSACMTALQPVFDDARPTCVVVQGDTTTAFVGALAAYYRRIPIAHVEAGLRSHDLYSPFPEEGNRTLIGRLATFHFAPTASARDDLAREGITEGVWVVGNTVVDALQSCRALCRDATPSHKRPPDGGRLVLVTAHRRESFGEPLRGICRAVRRLADSDSSLQVLFPVHHNPAVAEPVHELLGNHDRIELAPPLAYSDLILAMSESALILTDSGGIQEEAPSLGVPVLVMRDVTERVEGIEAGTARLVGTQEDRILDAAVNLLRDGTAYEAMATATNPYGDGTAARRILEVLTRELGVERGHEP